MTSGVWKALFVRRHEGGPVEVCVSGDRCVFNYELGSIPALGLWLATVEWRIFTFSRSVSVEWSRPTEQDMIDMGALPYDAANERATLDEVPW